MNDQEILNNIPKSWACEQFVYVSLDGKIYLKWYGFTWVGFEDGNKFICYETPCTRSLADIKELVNLRKELITLKS